MFTEAESFPINPMKISNAKDLEESKTGHYEQPNLLKERVMLQMELNWLLPTETECLLLYSQGSVYEHGNKAGRLLVHQLKAKQAANQITQI